MFNILFTRFYRSFINNGCPQRCYASLWFPQNMLDCCDCVIWCKYPPTRKKIRL